MNFQTFSQVAFAFRVTPELLAMGLFYALADGTRRRTVSGHPRRAVANTGCASRTLTFCIGRLEDRRIGRMLAE